MRPVRRATVPSTKSRETTNSIARPAQTKGPCHSSHATGRVSTSWRTVIWLGVRRVATKARPTASVKGRVRSRFPPSKGGSYRGTTMAFGFVPCLPFFTPTLALPLGLAWPFWPFLACPFLEWPFFVPALEKTSFCAMNALVCSRHSESAYCTGGCLKKYDEG